MTSPALSSNGHASMVADTQRPESDAGRRDQRWGDLERLRASHPMMDAVIEEVRGRRIRVGDHWLSDFASCNYLGFDLHPQIIESVVADLRRWGTHPSWSRLLGSPRPYVEIEDRLTELLGAPDTLLLPTITLIHLSVIPALAGQGRDHGKMNQRDGGQQQGVGGAQQFGEAVLDLHVGTGAPEEPRPARVGAPTPEVRHHRLDDLRMQVEAEVVTGSEVAEPVVADPDAAAPHLLDDGIHHRVGGAQPLEVTPTLVAAPGIRFRPLGVRDHRRVSVGRQRRARHPTTVRESASSTEDGVAG